MARAIWSGAISFGLVNVPVKAYTATKDHSVHFNQLEKGTGARIRYEKISDKTGKEVSPDKIELGYQRERGTYVIVDPDELDEIRPSTTRTIEVTDFVDLDEIDPIYYERTYWLAPDGEAATRAYRLLEAAMEGARKVGVGTVVMRNKQYLAAIRPLDGALAMSTMRFADEVVPRSAIDEVPSRKAKPDPKELKLAAQIIDSLATEWDPKRYHDTYTEQLRELIDKKAEGEQVAIEEKPAEKANVVDLMEALQASLDAAKQGPGKKGPANKARSGAAKAAARKTPARKAQPRKAQPRKAQPRKASARKSA
jgi:DNA end-binding protein Ku